MDAPVEVWVPGSPPQRRWLLDSLGTMCKRGNSSSHDRCRRSDSSHARPARGARRSPGRRRQESARRMRCVQSSKADGKVRRAGSAAGGRRSGSTGSGRPARRAATWPGPQSKTPAWWRALLRRLSPLRFVVAGARSGISYAVTCTLTIPAVPRRRRLRWPLAGNQL